MADSVKAFHHNGIYTLLPHSFEHGKQRWSPQSITELLLHAGTDDNVAPSVGLSHNFFQLVFQRGQICHSAAGIRPDFVFRHSHTSELIHEREADIEARLAKGSPREAVPCEAFQPAVDELGVQITLGSNKVDIPPTENLNYSNQQITVVADLFQVSHNDGFDQVIFHRIQHCAQAVAVLQRIATAMVKGCATHQKSVAGSFID